LKHCEFNGRYHILGGTINVIKGTKPDELTIKKLLEKIKTGGINEIILALNPDMEGETTSLFLTKAIKNLNLNYLKVTRFARGLPMGADLEYADEMTLTNALKYRNEI
jgi:recombination protein RecR